MTGEGDVGLMVVILEVVTSLTDELHSLAERYRSARPARDLEVGGGRGEGGLETGNPVTAAQLSPGAPHSVPAAPWAELRPLCDHLWHIGGRERIYYRPWCQQYNNPIYSRYFLCLPVMSCHVMSAVRSEKCSTLTSCSASHYGSRPGTGTVWPGHSCSPDWC